jgi:phosphomannomutase/phosphoglucomutase
MKLNANIFREYDIRGIAGKDLNEEVMERLGMAYTVYLRKNKALKHKTVVVGRDGRLSGKAFARALIDGITACGVNVIDIGEVPTPVLYYAMFKLKVDGGIMLTASHNPGNYNGMKIGIGKTTIFGEEIQKFRKMAEAGDFKLSDKPVTITRMDMKPRYRKEVQKRIKLKRKLKVVVDAGNGVGGVTAVPLYEAMGCEVIPLYCDVDGRFPNHHPDPTVEANNAALKRAVKKHKADVGIGFDGDVDRLGGCDDQGGMLSGDRLLTLFARQILKDKPGSTVIGEVKCSRLMYADITKKGGKAIMWRTGHSHIKAKMKAEHALLAGEMSGHIFFKHRWLGFDDAIYSGARLLEIIAEGRRPLSKHMATIPQLPSTPELTIDCPDDEKFNLVAAATDYFQNDLGLEVNTIGWGLVRASNTSPKLVMRVEAETTKRVKEIRKLIEDTVNRLKK